MTLRETYTRAYWDAALAIRERSPRPLSRETASAALTRLALSRDEGLARLASRAADAVWHSSTEGHAA